MDFVVWSGDRSISCVPIFGNAKRHYFLFLRTDMTKKRILVIDDEPTSHGGVAEVLADEGYEVAVAADGQEGIVLLPSFLPDLVLTDLRMPGLDGIGVLNYVKNLYPSIPVMIFTADTAIDAERTVKRLGAQDYINKPLNFDDLLARVARMFIP
jgi:DNA-binding response OmpR family regulator